MHEPVRLLISDLEAALASGPSERRLGMLDRVTELFLARAGGVGEAQVAVFDEVLLRLADGIESRARAELARSLALVANAPLVLVANLAHDASISVAAPVLQHSERLDDRTLSDCATKLSQAHLMAISRRLRLSTSVTDVLVTRGDQDVVRTVAGNDGACFSDAGFHVLVSRAGDDDLLAETVGLRADLPPANLNRLVRQASELVRRKLAGCDPARGRVTAANTENVAARAAPQRSYAAAERLVSALAREGSLDEETVRGFASAGRFEEAVAGLAALSGLTSDVVGQALTSEAGDPALIIGKAAALSWPTVHAILVMRSGGRPIAPRTLEDSRVNYMHLSRETAQRVTRFYRLRTIVNRPGQATPPRNGPPRQGLVPEDRSAAARPPEHPTQASRLDA